jgi:pyruvate dehydrogenase E2 component (dihydrolipoamide acetyltransferase)
MQEFSLPNLGDGIDTGDVLKVLVQPGDRVALEQPVLELETDKATVEVPSTVAGIVKEVRVKAGDKVKPGQAVLLVDDGAGEETKAPERASTRRESVKETPPAAEDAQPHHARADATHADRALAEALAADRRRSSAAATDEPKSPPEEPLSVTADRRRALVVDISHGRSPVAPAAQAAAAAPVGRAAPAAPSVRRLAREIGVDINAVTGSGPAGRISQDDVKEFSKRVLSSLGSSGQVALSSAQTPGAARPALGVPLPDLAKWGEVERKPMSGVRRKTAEHLSHAWTTIPHVTQFDRADVTALEAMRKKHAPDVEKAGGKLTVTAIVAKVVARALRAFPEFNAAVDLPGEAIVYRKYVNIGIAVDTEHGLLVPVIRQADQKNIAELSVEIQQLAEKARTRKLSFDEMSGGSMSITNLGGLGGTAFTPIVNWPEVAILGLSRSATEPVYVNGAFEPRLMLPLSLSYDHRVIDGATAIRFLRWVAEALEQPFLLALRG